jgi:beta-aspartyl-peptidase (threonine type)
MNTPRRYPRRLAAVGLLAAAALSAAVFAGPQPKPEADAKKAIQELLDAQAVAWNKGDLKGFMVGYWQSPDLTFFSAGTKTQGWQATLERYQKRYQAEGREMGQLTFSDLDIDVLGPDSACVRGRWKLVTAKETAGGLYTLILKKRPEGWRIVHDHTSANDRPG